MYRTGFIDLKDGGFSGWSLGKGLSLEPVDGRLCLSLASGASTDQSASPGQPVRAGLSTLTDQADSPVLETSFPFSAAIPSWSADTPDGSWMELLVRARRNGLWSRWFSMGIWSSGTSTVQRQSITGQQEEGARMDTDTLRLDTPAEGLQVRIKLSSADGRALPSVRRVCVAYSDPKPAAAIAAGLPADKAEAEKLDTIDPLPPATGRRWTGELSGVPRCSQMVYPDGGKVWCSPTCVAMILSYWRKDTSPCGLVIRKAVAGTYDAVYNGNGNWAFNTAYAASEGFDACVARFPSLASLEPWLAAGVPVALSVSWNNDEGRMLSGAPVSSSSGHLTLLVGFDAEGDPIMHEPASPADEYVRRTYRRAELEERWLTASGGACYLIYPQGHAVPQLA